MAGKDITGQRFGKLVALEQIGRHPRGGFVWRCQCDCGNTKDAITKDLGYGSVKSCGCLHAETEAKKRKVNPGDKFGMLTVVRQADSGTKHIRWECLCDCGNAVSRATNGLRSGQNPNCGCSRARPTYRHDPSRTYKGHAGKASDIKGQKFSRLVAIERDKSVKSNRAYWKCLCDCGETPTVAGTALRTGATKSCGCLAREIAAQIGKKSIRAAIAASTTHGMTNTKIFRIWSHMIERCEKKPSYVKRGIKVCDEWKDSFELFYEHVGDRPTPKHQIDRINNLEGYRPGNVRWVLPKENSRNRSDNHLLEYKGQTKCLAEWEEVTGINLGVLSWRIKKGWSAEKTLTTPTRHKAPNGAGRQKA